MRLPGWKESKIWLGVIAFSFLAFSPVFLRALPWEFDSFHFLGYVCEKNALKDQPIGANFVFSLLPCNIFAIRLLFFASLAVSCLFLGKWGALYSKKGWLAGIFVFGSLLFLTEYWKFENDALAYPLILASAYFFFKAQQKNTKSWTDYATSLLLLGAAATIWQGAMLWLIAFALTWKWDSDGAYTEYCKEKFLKQPRFWCRVLILLALALNFHKFIAEIAPKFGSATENLPGFGLLYQCFLFPSLMFLRFNKSLLPATILFLAIGWLNAKFAVQASFLLAIYAVYQFENTKGLMKWLPAIGAVITTVFLALSVQGLPPDSQELGAAQLAVKEAGSSQVCNEWSIGHLITYLGGAPTDYGGGQQQCTGCADCVVLTFVEQPNCRLLNRVGNDTDLRVYKC